MRGGFPESLLSRSGEASVRWRQDFMRTFLERDIPQLGVSIPAATLDRFWRMCAHHHGQLLNQSKLGAALGAMLDIETEDDLLGHPLRGASWEGWVIENVVTALSDWRAFFYRAATGAELDLVMEKGRARIGIECKASAAPAVGAGFWNALDDLHLDRAWIVAPVKQSLDAP